MVVAATALLGWVAHWPLMTSWLPGRATMKPVTAMCFLALGAALLVGPQRPKSSEWIGIAIAVVAGMSLVQDLIGVDFGIDRWLTPTWASAPSGLSMRMAPATAISLTAAGCALALRRQQPHVARVWTIIVAATSCLGMLGYVIGVDALYNVKPFQSVSLPSTLALLFAAIGLWTSSIGLRGRPPVPRPLQHHLVLFGLAVVGPLLAYGLYAGLQLSAGQKQAQREQLVRAAAGLSREIDREIIGDIETLQALAASPSLKSGDLAAFHAQATAAFALNRGGALLLFDKAGEQIANTRVAFGAALPKGPSVGIAGDVVATGRMHVSNLFIGRLTRSFQVEVAVPCIIDGEVRYVLSKAIDINILARILTDHGLPAGWLAHISDNNGVVIARSERHEEFVGKPLAPEDALSGKSGISQAVDLVGRPSLRAFHQSEVTDWRTAVWAPNAVLNATAYVLWRSLAILGLFSLGLVGAASIIMGGRLTRSLTRTRHLIGVLATQGHSPVPAHSATVLSEANELAEALQTAAARRLEAESALRASEATFRAMFAISSVGKAQADIESGRYVRVNDAFCKLLGYTEPEVLARTFSDITHPDDRAASREGIKYLLSGEASGFDSEKRYVRKDGSTVWVRSTVNLIRDTDGRPLRFTGVVQDISERKRQEHELAVAAERAAVAQLATRSFNYEHLPSTGLTARSPAFCELFGYTPEEERQTAEMWRGLIHGDDSEMASAAISRGIEMKRGYALDYRVRHRSGRYLWVHDRARVIHGIDGAAERVVGMVLDISEQKAREEQVALLMKEVNHRAKNMLGLVQAIARQTASKSPDDFVPRFSERIQGLSASQDLLVRNEWRGVDLEDLVRAQLSLFSDLIDTRILLSGQEAHISAAAAQAIGLALHELATNAGKYGALSNAVGRIEIGWSIVGDTFRMRWIERGGPVVTPPQRRGFGSTVISSMVKASVEGNVDLTYLPAGLEWLLSCPASKVIDEDVRNVAPAAE